MLVKLDFFNLLYFCLKATYWLSTSPERANMLYTEKLGEGQAREERVNQTYETKFSRMSHFNLLLLKCCALYLFCKFGSTVPVKKSL
jgi:hypothetical protein